MHRYLVLFLTLLFLPNLSRADTDAPAALNIPRPDRAEIVSVAPGATDGPKAELSAAKARKVLKLLQRFKWIGPAGSCDKIQYVLHFYANDKLLASDGICFHCGCFVPIETATQPGGDALTFDLQAANAKFLDTYLAKFFPLAK
jgi:Rieske Fe-S protein